MKNKILLLGLIACTSCALSLREAHVEVPTEYLYSDGFNTSNTQLSERWWEQFGDPTLDELILCALRENRNLAATAASVEAARHYLKVARAEFLPSLSFETIAYLVHEETITEQEYTIAPTLEWEISLFGELRNTKKAAAAALFLQEWNFRGVWLALTAEVATSYFTLLQYQRSLYIAQRSYELRCTATSLVEEMYRYGMSNGTELMQAKSLVYAAKTEVQKYQRAVATTSLSLSTLLGQAAQAVNWDNVGEALITDFLPFEIPVGLPSSLLERRPDVMKSYYTMEQAAAKVGISRAARYPSITLTGSGGVYASSLEGLTQGDPLLWSATGELIAPIFSWGALRRKELIARQDYAASVAEYEQCVLEALADVEKALVTIETYSDQSAATAALVLANSKIAQNSSAMYRSGLGDYLSVIDAERELYSSQISLVEVVAQQYINYITLFKALGGGW
ncbi:MAG: efflux transporter outer membrane subunit [Rikenellaceae bacterium]